MKPYNKNGVIVYHYPLNVYLKGDMNCMSIDGHTGIITGINKTKKCTDCEFNKFGSGENGEKACCQSRILLFLHNNTLEEIKIEHMSEFSKYLMRLLSSGRKTCSVLTEIYETDGRKMFRFVRELTETEIEQVNKRRDSIKCDLMKN